MYSQPLHAVLVEGHANVCTPCLEVSMHIVPVVSVQWYYSVVAWGIRLMPLAV